MLTLSCSNFFVLVYDPAISQTLAKRGCEGIETTQRWHNYLRGFRCTGGREAPDEMVWCLGSSSVESTTLKDDGTNGGNAYIGVYQQQLGRKIEG